MKKSTKIIIAAFTALTLSGGVFAYGKHNHWKMDPEDKAEFVVKIATKKLDLNEPQRQNLEDLTGNMLALMQEMRASREIQIQEVQQLIAEPVLDQNRALQIIQQKTQAINDRAPAVIASLALFLDSLNTEQKAELQSYMDEHHKKHRSEH